MSPTRVSFSLATIVLVLHLCFNCDIETSRHNNKAHTNIEHPKKPVVETIKMLRVQSRLYIFMTKDQSKKAKLDTAFLEQDDGRTKFNNKSNTKILVEADLIIFN